APTSEGTSTMGSMQGQGVFQDVLGTRRLADVSSHVGRFDTEPKPRGDLDGEPPAVERGVGQVGRNRMPGASLRCGIEKTDRLTAKVGMAGLPAHAQAARFAAWA